MHLCLFVCLLFILKFRITFTSTKYLEKVSPQDRDVSVTVRNEIKAKLCTEPDADSDIVQYFFVWMEVVYSQRHNNCICYGPVVCSTPTKDEE